MQATTQNNTDKTTSPSRLYASRIFICKTSKDASTLIDLIIQSNTARGKKDIQIETVSLSQGGRTKEYSVIQIDGRPPIYVFALEERRGQWNIVKSCYELVAFTETAPIVYVHESAMNEFKLASLHNYVVILFHDNEEFEAYFKAGLFGDDPKECEFAREQKRLYLLNETKPTEEFAAYKAEKKGDRKPSKTRKQSDPLKKSPKTPKGNLSSRSNDSDNEDRLDRKEKPKKGGKGKKAWSEVARNSKNGDVEEEEERRPVQRESKNHSDKKETGGRRPSRDNGRKPSWNLPEGARTGEIVQAPIPMHENPLAQFNPQDLLALKQALNKMNL